MDEEKLDMFVNKIIDGDVEGARSIAEQTTDAEDRAALDVMEKLCEFFEKRRAEAEKDIEIIRRRVEEAISEKQVEIARRSPKVLQIVTRASQDEEFRQTLLESPQQAANILGLDLNPYELAALSDLREDDMASQPRQLDERILKRRGF